MPGYDKNRFIKDSDEELDKFCCGICLGILDNPVVTHCCQQTYCCDCITQWLSRENTCPNDRQCLTTTDLRPPLRAFSNLFYCINQWLSRESNVRKPLTGSDLSPPPRAFINLMNKLRIRCDYYSNGCQSVVLLSELAKHSTDCEFNANRKCKNCEIILTSDHNCIEFLKSKVKTLTKDIETNTQMISELITENEAKLKDVVEKKDYEYFKLKEDQEELYYDICEQCADLNNEVKILTKDNQAKIKTITKLRKDVKILNKKLAENNVKRNEQGKIIDNLTSEIQKLKNNGVPQQATNSGIDQAAAIAKAYNQPNNHKLVDKTKPIPPRLYNHIIRVIKDGMFKKDNFQDLAEYISDTLSGYNDDEEEGDSNDDFDNDATHWPVIVYKGDHDEVGIFYRYDDNIEINFGDYLVI